MTTRTIVAEETAYALGTYVGGSLTVCDPCYLLDENDKLVFADPDVQYSHGPFAHPAVGEQPLADGEWEAFVVIFDDGSGWGRRVWRAGIRLADWKDTDKETDSAQGVDAGMVGFFINRPYMHYDDCYSSDEYPMVKLTSNDSNAAFITSSGVGDGYYKVAIFWYNEKIVSVEIDYYGEDED